MLKIRHNEKSDMNQFKRDLMNDISNLNFEIGGQ